MFNSSVWASLSYESKALWVWSALSKHALGNSSTFITWPWLDLTHPSVLMCTKLQLFPSPGSYHSFIMASVSLVLLWCIKYEISYDNSRTGSWPFYFKFWQIGGHYEFARSYLYIFVRPAHAPAHLEVELGMQINVHFLMIKNHMFSYKSHRYTIIYEENLYSIKNVRVILRLGEFVANLYSLYVFLVFCTLWKIYFSKL